MPVRKTECDRCQGSGQVVVGYTRKTVVRRKCPDCKGKGYVKIVHVCVRHKLNR